MNAGALLGVCLSLAAAPDVPPRFVPVQAFTLAWTHSIEKIRWEEDYRVERDGAGRPVLVPGRARVLGSGAGMDPPPDAVHRADGWYEYQPKTGPLPVLHLTRSAFTADYDWCVAGRCRPLRAVMPTDGGVTELAACDRVEVGKLPGGGLADGIIAHEGTWLGGEAFVSFDQKAITLLSQRGKSARLP